MEELIKAFSFENISKSGAKFDIKKAKWFNEQYLKHKSDEEVIESLSTHLLRRAEMSDEQLAKIVHLLKERVTFSQDILKEADFLFDLPTQYDETIVQKKWTAEVSQVLTAYRDELPLIENFDAESAKHTLHLITEKLNIKIGKVMQPLRVALTGVGAGPDLMLSMEIMGKEAVITRLNKAFNELQVPICE